MPFYLNREANEGDREKRWKGIDQAGVANQTLVSWNLRKD
jgi:hypothetical protein